MRLKPILSSLIALCLAYTAQGQSLATDALTFSQEYNGGTARFKGLGNVRTALGGDISSINGNPAGLGFYGQSDINIGVAYNSANNKGSYFGTSTSRSQNRFGVDNAGVVFHFPKRYNTTGWQNFNIGISYENLNTFKNNLRYEGNNNQNTVVQMYADNMANDPNSQYTKDMYDSYLTEELVGATDEFFPITKELANKQQISDGLMAGTQSRTAFAFGANYGNTFYIGANVGISSLRYESSLQFSEIGRTKSEAEIIADNPTSPIANPALADNRYANANYDLFDEYNQITSASGFDFKLGAIFKPAVDWNIGLNVASPTWYTVRDESSKNISVIYNDGTADFDERNIGFDDTADEYMLRTPWKFSLGATKFFSRGLLTAEAEMVNYASAKLNNGLNSPSMQNNFASVNDEIKDLYKSAVNIRAGGELLLTQILSGRAGFNYFGSPYKNSLENTQYSGSLGLGIKLTQSLYADIAVTHFINNYQVRPYTIDETWWESNSPTADVKHTRTNAALTIGAKF